MRTVAERVHANPSNITVVVARLDGRGYVTREGTSDRRVKGVRLTKAGRELRQRLADRLREDHPAVGDLSPTQQAALVRLLRALDLQSVPHVEREKTSGFCSSLSSSSPTVRVSK